MIYDKNALEELFTTVNKEHDLDSDQDTVSKNVNDVNINNGQNNMTVGE